MSAPTRVIARISAALGVMLLIVSGTAANAQVPPPDPTTVGAPAPPPPTALSSGVSFAQEIGWMFLGAALVLACAVIWYAAAVLFRRRHTPALRAS
jgi:hypothetical protein